MALTDKLTAIADAIRLKRDTATDMTLDDMALQIALISGGGGDEIKTDSGVYTPTSDYKVVSSPTQAYTGDLRIQTKLDRIDAVIVASENWLNRTPLGTTQFGWFLNIRTNKYLGSESAPALNRYFIVAAMNMTASSYYGASSQTGAFLNGITPNIAPNEFSFRVHSTSYPAKANVPLHWVAIQFPDNLHSIFNTEE